MPRRQKRSRIALSASLLGLSLLAAVLVSSGSARAPGVSKPHGTLRVAIYVDPGNVEPATRATEQAIQLLFATQLALVAYREDGGPGTGRKIIPFGAESWRLSHDGKTYTFRIRRGLRFSDGSPVTASNFRFGFERVLDPRVRGRLGSQYANVVGAQAFMQGQAESVSGVRIQNGELTFHLIEAEPDFLSRLTLPLVTAMPLGLPPQPGGVDAPLQSAGPYYVKEYVPGRKMRLVRNRYWKRSTLPSRPANFQEIDYLMWPSADAAFAAVQNGDADVATVVESRDLNEDLVRDLKSSYGVNHRQFWVRPKNRRYDLVFNTRRPLFHDAKLRRAVSYALDREQMAKKIGPLAAHPTDQLLLPISAGFRNWKVYPFHANLAKARLLARGMQQGQVVTLVVGSTGSPPDVATVIQSNLAKIGLRVQVKLVAPLIFNQYLVNPENSWDIATATGNALRVDPMVFVNLALEGQRWTSIAGVYNFSGFDDHKWIRRMRRTYDMAHGRLKAYGLLDRDLMKESVPVAPFATGNTFTFVSARVGCMRSSANPGYLYPNLAALCFPS